MKIDTVILSIFLVFIIVSSSVVAIPENKVFGSYPLIYKVYPNPYTKGEGDEFISIINPIDRTVNLNGYSITDLEGEIFFPPFSIPPGDVLLGVFKRRIQKELWILSRFLLYRRY